jgi:hypothetical protein
VILDLKFQKIVNGLDGLGIVSDDPDFRALIGVLNQVGAAVPDELKAFDVCVCIEPVVSLGTRGFKQ